MFKVIVAGSRGFSDYEMLERKLDRILVNKVSEGIEVVCGEARGADALGKRYALNRGYKVSSFPADWKKYGVSAGFRRNWEMADYADALVAFWDGKSSGTQHMIMAAEVREMPMRVIRYREEDAL